MRLLSSMCFDPLQGGSPIVSATIQKTVSPRRAFSTSIPLQKVKKAAQNKSKKMVETVTGDGPLPEDKLVAAEVRELRDVSKILQTELTRHFSLKADVRDFENVDVTVNGKHYKMNHLARITMRGGDALMINFSENPASIKEAKLALEKSMLGLNPQQEGVALHVSLPKVTRELREQAVKNSKKIFNDYKTELNRIFAKHDKLNTNSGADLDTVHNRSATMLECKRQFDEWGKELLEEKQKAVMQEIK
uniref:Ribosome-recycling factor, mitochondrial n=1 Tax=Ditylenchus dipsaci TaxID=166011 RepID=A0A915D9X3_9BILA